MKIKWILSAVVFAASVWFAGAASAETPVWYQTCNSDGFVYTTTVYSNGSYCVVNTGVKCGALANFPMGDGFKIIFSKKTQVSPAGQAFLNRLEKEGMAPVKRIPVRVKGAAPELPGRPETIELRPADVGPVLARFLTSIDPDWRK